MFRHAYTFLSFSLLSLACVPNLISDRESFLKEADRRALRDYRKEVDLGQQMAGALIQHYETYDHPKVLAYINAVGRYLGQHSGAPQRKYMFAVLNTEMVNAFACPGSYILITRGALKQMEDEAELAMVLSHEIAHVEKQHIFRSVLQSSQQDSVDPHAHDPVLKMRKRHQGRFYDDTVSKQIGNYLPNLGAFAHGLATAARSGLSLLVEKGLDKELEHEADEVGFDIAVRALYDPYALNRYLESLEKRKDQTKLLQSTHPKISERITFMEKHMQEVKADLMVGAKAKERFLEHKKYF